MAVPVDLKESILDDYSQATSAVTLVYGFVPFAVRPGWVCLLVSCLVAPIWGLPGRRPPPGLPVSLR